MSRYIDINQLLGEIGTSDRSAGDPWTLSRSNRGTVKGNAFSPPVVGDLGSQLEDLRAGIQSAERVTQADTVASSAPGLSGTGTAGAGSPSSSAGFLGSLLHLFPLASGIAKLFGFGDNDAQTAAPTPYQLPPSINFEGAMSSTSSGITNLSYGPDGLPRTAGTGQIQPSTPRESSPSGVASNFTDSPAGMLISGPGSPVSQSNPNGTVGQLGSLGLFNNAKLPSNTAELSTGDPTLANGVTSTNQIVGQLSLLGNSSFAAEPSKGTPVLSPDFLSQPNLNRGSESASPMNFPGSEAPSLNGAGNAATGPQSGHSILVQVQAMDSQSFMDHSQDIAQAVRQAMLNMNSLNDVVQDL